MGLLVYKVVRKILKELRLMRTELTQFEAKVNAAFAAVATSLTTIGTGITNIQEDQATLLEEIQKLKDGATGLTAEEKKMLDDIAVKADKISTDMISVRDVVQATADAVPDKPAGNVSTDQEVSPVVD